MIWNEVATLLKTCASIHLKNLTLQTSCVDVEHFGAAASAASAATVGVASAASVAPAASAEKIVRPLPPSPLAPPPPVPAVPKLALDTVVAQPPAPANKGSISSDSTPAKKLKITATKNSIDPVVLGIELTEPLYVGAPHSTQKRIETDAAEKLEGQLDGLYKSACGRSRGWTKVGLEGMLKPRCASGGDMKELDRAKKGFLWSLATEDKALSAFLDFVCCAKQIRCVIMNNEKKMAYLYPAADKLDDDGKAGDYPIYFMDTGGHKLHGLHGADDLLKYVDSEGWTLQPPASVVHSLSGLSLDELESVGLKLGMKSVAGKKADRIQAVAAYKTRARLQTI
jgi:hypothetical protein